MGKANIYLILIVIIIPVFFVSGQNKRTSVFSKKNTQLHVSMQKYIPENSIENIKILCVNNSTIIYKTGLRKVNHNSVENSGVSQFVIL
mgnify:FL=1